MFKSFDALWETCEALHQQISPDDNSSSILDELLLKVRLYQAINNQEMPEEEKQAIRTRAIGEVLLVLTNLSLRDNINVFAALEAAHNYRSIDFFSRKHQ